MYFIDFKRKLERGEKGEENSLSYIYFLFILSLKLINPHIVTVVSNAILVKVQYAQYLIAVALCHGYGLLFQRCLYFTATLLLSRKGKHAVIVTFSFR